MTRAQDTKTSPAGRFADDQWHAVVVSQDGFLMEDEHVRGWAAAAEEGDDYFYTDAEPRSIEIVRGSACPVPQTDQPDEEFYRMPGSYQTADQFVEIEDLDEREPTDVLRLWDLAQRAARGMNAEATS